MKKLFLTIALASVMTMGYAETTTPTVEEYADKKETVQVEAEKPVEVAENNTQEAKEGVDNANKEEQTSKAKADKKKDNASKPQPEPTFFQQYGMIIMLVAMFAIMYFLMIRPQRKRQKELQEWRNTIETGTKVVIGGGIQGVVKDTNPSETYFTVEVAKGVNIKVDKNMVFADVEQTIQK